MASSAQSNPFRSSSGVNPFLRAWAWKREHRPDKDRFDLPYVHRLILNGQTRALSIKQARFSTKGFASTVWDSAIVLSKYLEASPQLVDGKTCIELGAGCGLPGIVAACLGASSVLLTDFSENLPLLEQNVIANGVADTTDVAALDWGNSSDFVKRTFDVILATDVMYDADVTRGKLENNY